MIEQGQSCIQIRNEYRGLDAPNLEPVTCVMTVHAMLPVRREPLSFLSRRMRN